MERPSWAPPEADLEHPSVARVYDYYLGGSHNFASDRAFAHRALQALPDVPALVRDNRAFLRRVVRHLCAAGIDQFLDLGSGIPTEGNVPAGARAAIPRARVVYVDRDAVGVLHSRHLLRGDGTTTALLADVRDAAQVLDLATSSGIDLGRPVAVLAISVLHFLDDAEDPAGLMARYLAAAPSGSHLAISHASSERRPEAAAFQRVYDRPDSPHAVHMRTQEEVTALFGDLEPVAPGVVHVPLWRPDPSDGAPDVPANYPGYAGLGRKA